jgi:hypothetical protein
MVTGPEGTGGDVGWGTGGDVGCGAEGCVAVAGGRVGGSLVGAVVGDAAVAVADVAGCVAVRETLAVSGVESPLQARVSAAAVTLANSRTSRFIV